MRLTESGEFIHAAPVVDLRAGLPYSVSHGCIGLSSSDADWLYGCLPGRCRRRDEHRPGDGSGQRDHRLE